MRALSITALLALLGLVTSSGFADWQGEIIESAGETRVVNPEEPSAGENSYELQELWRAGGEDDDEVMFGVVGEVVPDQDGTIYVLDSQLSEILVFSPAGDLLRRVGREGEGPGEFRNGADLFWTPGGQLGVVQAWPGKVVRLMPEGDPGDVFKLPFRDGVGFQAVSRGDGNQERIVLSGTAWATEDGQQMNIAYLKAYDAEGNELANFCEEASKTQFGGFEFQEESWVDFQRRWAMAPDGRVAAAMSFGDYRIHVWNADGSLDRIIERPGYKPVPRTDREKRMFQTIYDRFTNWNPGSTFQVSDNHQAVSRLLFRNDGNLWVQNGSDQWRGDQGMQVSYDVFDREGRFVQRVRIVGEIDAVQDGLFFFDDKALLVTNLMGARMGSMGIEEEDGEALDLEPVTVIANRLTPAGAQP